MHGLVNCAFQGFLEETYGRDVWNKVRNDARLGFESFEPMLRYDPVVTERVMLAACFRLDKSMGAFLEDVGTWVVTHPGAGAIRRLLRFGGADFRDFLLSLDELPGRAQMAIPYMTVPLISLNQYAGSRVELILTWRDLNLSAVVQGALRAIADDYGALVLLEAQDTGPLTTVIDVNLLDNSYAQGRDFTLGGAAE